MPEAQLADVSSPKGPFFQRDREAAREAGRKGGLKKGENARLKREDPAAYIRATFDSERAALSKELLDAAFGRGSWAVTVECDGCGNHIEVPGLPPEKRLGALSRALEYAVGRPTPRKEEEGPKVEAPPGLTIE